MISSHYCGGKIANLKIDQCIKNSNLPVKYVVEIWVWTTVLIQYVLIQLDRSCTCITQNNSQTEVNHRAPLRISGEQNVSLSSFCINFSELIHWPLNLNHWGKCFRPDRKLKRNITTSFAAQRGVNADEPWLCNSFSPIIDMAAETIWKIHVSSLLKLQRSQSL